MNIQSCVKQGYAVSGFLVILTMDWIIRRTAEVITDIRWNLTSKLEDQKFSDNIRLQSSSHAHIQKTNLLTKNAVRARLNIWKKKTELMRINSSCTRPVTLGQNPIKDCSEFVYLGATVSAEWGRDEDIANRLTKSNICNVWQSKRLH